MNWRVVVPALCVALNTVHAQPARVELARYGRTSYVIVADTAAGFAARELSSYLGRISGAAFRVSDGRGARKQVVLRVAKQASPDEYRIEVRGDTLLLNGSTPRAVLYASYDLLERLGCRFIAPQLGFYEANEAEIVPRTPVLVYRAPARIYERPMFAMRKLNVEEGLSHDTTSLRAIVAWMAKARFNTISVPMDYGGAGRVRWDNWRTAITPDLKQRGIDIEVGGHGYQNFLNASMEGGSLFTAHPDWFGRDSSCAPSRATQNVFNTESEGAVSFFAEQVARYVRERPEIDILELWPPDGARWMKCGSVRSPSDRQARLLNEMVGRLPATVRVQTIAYAEAQDPPALVKLDDRIIVDVCPIGQNFDVQINDMRGKANAEYARLILRWRADFSGHLGLYSYYRRYAWLSLPVILPHYMQRDMRWYASVPMDGFSGYAEPGDWYTYELNHYVMAKLAWSVDADVPALVNEYIRLRYEADARVAGPAYAMLEDVVRRFGSVQNITPKTADEIRAARARVEVSRRALAAPRSPSAKRLALMLDYASRDLAIQALRAGGDTAAMRPLVEEVVALHTKNADRGVFLLSGHNDRARIYRHYGLKVE